MACLVALLVGIVAFERLRAPVPQTKPFTHPELRTQPEIPRVRYEPSPLPSARLPIPSARPVASATAPAADAPEVPNTAAPNPTFEPPARTDPPPVTAVPTPPPRKPHRVPFEFV